MNLYQKRMDAAFKAMEDIRKKAEAEKRSMTEEELTQRATHKAEIEAAKREWEDAKEEERLRGELYGEGFALTVEGEGKITIPDAPIYRGSAATMLGQQLMDIRTMTRPQNFNDSEVKEARSRTERAQKRSIERLEKQLKEENRAATSGGMTVGVPTEGGVFLQGETAVELMTNGFNNSEILPRTSKRTLTASQYVEIIGIDESSRVTGSRGGGIRVYTNKELGEFTASKTKMKTIRIEPQKLTGLFAASGEMMRNVTFMGQEVRQLFGDEFAFKGQDLSIRGSGAGEAMGILNAGCLVSVPKETGQKAKTILTKNLSNMWARYRGMSKNAVWLINRDCGPQLDELSITAGTGALEPRFVAYDSQGILRIKGAPVVEIEQCETLGTVGDIILADWSQYVCADKGDIQEAMSIHVDFIYDQELYRFISYFDGQPRWSSALTPYKGNSNTVSPFVVLASRA
jgi:HK97 family phage major capsid protein